MRYAMLLKPHANIKYQQSLVKLALIELECTLKAWEIESQPSLEMIQNEPFLVFETENMTEEAWRAISRHSAVCFTAQMQGDLLVPLRRDCRAYLPKDLPHVLKYKGKTNVDFTLMLLHCARAASTFAKESKPLWVLDPLCGKATTLFCALEEGDHAMGVELDWKAIVEADGYFERFLQLHRIKHRREIGSRTLPQGRNAKTVTYAVADSAEHMKQGNTRTLCMAGGNTTSLGNLTGEGSFHLLVGDLPYGIQHAPMEGSNMSSLQRLIWAAMPAYARALKPGGAAALSFNTHTLRKAEVIQAMKEAGFIPLEAPPYHDFAHWVEQAVERDVVIARKA